MTLATRVVARSLLVLAAVLAGVALLTFQLVAVGGREEVDALLRDEAGALASSLAAALPAAAGLDGVLAGPEAAAAARRALAAHPSSARHVAVVTVGGTRLQADGGPPRVAALARGRDAPPVEPGRLRTEGPVRVVDVAVLDPGGAAVATVTALAPLDGPRAAAGAALARVVVAGALGLVVGGMALVVVVRRSLRPLREVSSAAGAIDADDLATRVPVPPTGDEVAEVATELNDLLDRIAAAEETRRRYLAAVSHEVRTPLAVAEGHLSLLEADATAAVVRGELVRLRRILDDLLAIARGRDELEVRREPVFLPDLFDAARSRFAALPVSVEAAPPVVVLGDEARLEQCLANLVANAVDHNPPGTGVVVAAAVVDSTVRLRVADDGAGVDPAVGDRAFEPFVTSRPAGADRLSGLGLAVVRSLVAAQGGTVELASTAAGTTATISLPVATA